METVIIRVHGIFTNGIVRKTFQEPIEPGTTIKEIFAQLDRKKAMGRKFFSSLKRLTRKPRILINGQPIDLGAGLSTPLRQGDEIAILSTLAEI